MLRFLAVGSLIFASSAAWWISLPNDAEADQPPRKLRTQVRRPVAIATDGPRLLVGNRESGSLTVIDRRTNTIIAEHPIAERIADMSWLPQERRLLVVDDKQSRLIGGTLRGQTVSVNVLAETPFPGSKLAWDAEARTAFLTARWAHRLMVFTLDEALQNVVETRSIKLPFAPLELLLLQDRQTLLVADAFSNRLAVVDSQTGKLVAVREIEGHNIRGLAQSDDGQQILIAHQHMPKQALADYEEVHWGRMVTNAVQVFDVRHLLDPQAKTLAQGWRDEHGGIGSATGDPSEILAGPKGLVAVAFGGVGEVVIHRKGYKKRIPVGAHPEAMALADQTLYVVNRFDDSLSVIDLEKSEVTGTISLGPAPRLTSEQRGERLFFDARLSHDGWMSCHSCHSEGHTAGLVVDTLGDGDYGAPKLVPTLLGTRDTQPWGWDGNTALFREQIQKSITTTMHGEPLSARDMEDLAAYLSSLNSPPPPERLEQTLVDQGKKVFHARGCADCHAPPAYTTPVQVDVSLLDELQRSTFNPPSLRGVSQRQRYFHDGRAQSLDDVLLKVKHQIEEPLPQQETQALLAFLRSL